MLLCKLILCYLCFLAMLLWYEYLVSTTTAAVIVVAIFWKCHIFVVNVLSITWQSSNAISPEVHRHFYFVALWIQEIWAKQDKNHERLICQDPLRTICRIEINTTVAGYITVKKETIRVILNTESVKSVSSEGFT